MPNSLKKWIENNPASTVISVIMSTAVVVSGVTGYFAKRIEADDLGQQKVKFISDQTTSDNSYKDKINQLTSEKDNLSRDYAHQIDLLTQSLTSIKRGIGDQKTYVDVHTLQIPVVEVRNLSIDFKEYDNNSFFVNQPKYGNWTYQYTTEGDANKLGPFKSIVEEMEQLLGDRAKEILGSPAHVWVAPPVADFDFSMQGDTVSGTLRPNIILMKISPEILSKKISGLGHALSDLKQNDEDRSKQIALVSKTIESLRAGETASDGTNGSSRQNENLPQNIQTKSATTSEQAINDKIEKADRINKQFDELYAADTAGFLFVDGLYRMFLASSAIEGSTFKIYSAQKIANVMYISADINISKAHITKTYGTDCSIDQTDVDLNRELFFVSYGSDGYLIQTEVPTCNGRSDAFAWITQWLVGLRISIPNPT
jgi:hypothetical protein